MDSGRSREIVGILGLGTALFVLAALLSLQVGSGRLMGPFGRTIATWVYGLSGVCSYLLALALIAVSVRLLMDRAIARTREIAGAALGLVSLAALVHLIGGDYRLAGYAAGGVVGEHVAEVLRALVSTAGTALLAVTGLVVACVIATPLRMRQVGISLLRVARAGGRAAATAGAAAGTFCGEVVRAVLPERDHDEYLDDDFDDDDEDYDAHAIDEADAAAHDPPIIEATAPVPAVPSVIASDAGDTVRTDDGRTERVEMTAAIARMEGDGDAARSGDRRGAGKPARARAPAPPPATRPALTPATSIPTSRRSTSCGPRRPRWRASTTATSSSSIPTRRSASRAPGP